MVVVAVMGILAAPLSVGAEALVPCVAALITTVNIVQAGPLGNIGGRLPLIVAKLRLVRSELGRGIRALGVNIRRTTTAACSATAICSFVIVASDEPNRGKKGDDDTLRNAV